MDNLVRRTRLAKMLGIPMPTVKYYTSLGLFYFSRKTEHGQYLYDPEEMRRRYEKIRSLKDKRLTILEIKDQLDIQGLLSKCETRRIHAHNRDSKSKGRMRKNHDGRQFKRVPGSKRIQSSFSRS